MSATTDFAWDDYIPSQIRTFTDFGFLVSYNVFKTSAQEPPPYSFGKPGDICIGASNLIFLHLEYGWQRHNKAEDVTKLQRCPMHRNFACWSSDVDVRWRQISSIITTMCRIKGNEAMSQILGSQNKQVDDSITSQSNIRRRGSKRRSDGSYSELELSDVAMPQVVHNNQETDGVDGSLVPRRLKRKRVIKEMILDEESTGSAKHSKSKIRTNTSGSDPQVAFYDAAEHQRLELKLEAPVDPAIKMTQGKGYINLEKLRKIAEALAEFNAD